MVLVLVCEVPRDRTLRRAEQADSEFDGVDGVDESSDAVGDGVGVDSTTSLMRH